MRRALADLVAYGKQYLRSPAASFFTLAFPIILILIFGGVFGNPEQVEITLYVQDLDDTALSAGVIAALNQTGVLALQTVPPNEDMEAYVRAQSIPIAVQIPVGFEGDVGRAVGGDPTAQPNLVLYGDISSSTYQTVEGIVAAVVTGLNFELNQATPVVSTTAVSISQREVTYIDFFLPGVIGITVLTPIFAIAATAAEYRQRHYFKLLATTPLRKGEFLLSRTLLMILLMFASVGLMLLVTRLAFQTVFVLDAIAVALIIAGTVLFVSIGNAIGSFAREPEAASAVANVVYFPMMFLTGTFFPVEIMPSFIQTFSRVLPLTYFNEGLRATLVFGDLDLALTNLGILTFVAVVLFLLSAWLLRWRAE